MVEKELSAFRKHIHSVIFVGESRKKPQTGAIFKSRSASRERFDWVTQKVDDEQLTVQYMRPKEAAGG